jgi:hypothetical protein
MPTLCVALVLQSSELETTQRRSGRRARGAGWQERLRAVFLMVLPHCGSNGGSFWYSPKGDYRISANLGFVLVGVRLSPTSVCADHQRVGCSQFAEN